MELSDKQKELFHSLFYLSDKVSKEVDSLRKNNTEIPDWLIGVQNNCLDTICLIPLSAIKCTQK